MTKIYNLPDNAGFIIENKDENTNGFQYTFTDGKALVTTIDTTNMEEGFFGGDIVGAIQNTIIATMAAPKEATVAELNVLLALVAEHE
jgi:hypothetical protein